jgi:hypothetical protein
VGRLPNLATREENEAKNQKAHAHAALNSLIHEEDLTKMLSEMDSKATPKHEPKSSHSPGAGSSIPPGQDDIVDWLRRMGKSVTRENYTRLDLSIALVAPIPGTASV